MKRLLYTPILIVLLCSYTAIYGQTCTLISLADTIKACPHSKVTIPAGISVPAGYVMLDTNWSPASGLSNPKSLTPTVTVSTISALYKLTLITEKDTNLVVNGDFNAGNIGFSSSYTYSSSSVYTEGYYSITTDPHSVHPGAPSFGDHTSGIGNMMVINGASTPVDVWCQSIPVTPNTYYAFSAWFANWSPADTGSGTPELQFKINGTLVGSPVYIKSLPGIWEKFYILWYSGSNTTAGICINDLVTAPTGNDFSLDDISFKSSCISEDSVYIKIDSFSFATSPDTSICSGQSIALNAVGATTYNWSPATGLSCTSCANPSATPTNTTTYSVTGTNATGCTATKTVTVGVKESSLNIATNTKAICNDSSAILTASGGVNYNWNPSSDLSCDTCATIIVSPHTATWYVLTALDTNGCLSKDSISIGVFNSVSLHAARQPNAECSATTVQLLASSPDLNISYRWSPGKYLSDSTISNPVATPQETPITYYVVGRMDHDCPAIDSVIVYPHKQAFVDFPTGFSPNGDGHNDVLYVRGSNIATLNMSIFNRWGQKVFETNDINKGWDGNFNGNPQPVDTYGCLLKVTTLDGCSIKKKGNVTLLK